MPVSQPDLKGFGFQRVTTISAAMCRLQGPNSEVFRALSLLVSEKKGFRCSLGASAILCFLYFEYFAICKDYFVIFLVKYFHLKF